MGSLARSVQRSFAPRVTSLSRTAIDAAGSWHCPSLSGPFAHPCRLSQISTTVLEIPQSKLQLQFKHLLLLSATQALAKKIWLLLVWRALIGLSQASALPRRHVLPQSFLFRKSTETDFSCAWSVLVVETESSHSAQGFGYAASNSQLGCSCGARLLLLRSCMPFKFSLLYATTTAALRLNLAGCSSTILRVGGSGMLRHLRMRDPFESSVVLVATWSFQATRSSGTWPGPC